MPSSSIIIFVNGYQTFYISIGITIKMYDLHDFKT